MGHRCVRGAVAVVAAGLALAGTGTASAGTAKAAVPAPTPAAGKPCLKAGATARVGTRTLKCTKRTAGPLRGSLAWGVVTAGPASPPPTAKAAATVVVPAPAPAPEPLTPLAAQGKEIFLNGPGRGGPCAMCHGLAGNGGSGPRIVGASEDQIRAALARRTMASIFGELSPEQVSAVSAYLATLR